MGTSQENVYLEQVLEQQQQVDQELRGWRGKAAQLQHKLDRPLVPSAPALAAAAALPASRTGPGAESVRAVDYRVTGFWFWKTVVVPPNVYVIHTRRGRAEPVT